MRKGFVVGTVVVERIFDIFAMCFLLGVFLLAQPLFISHISGRSEAYASLRFWGTLGVVFATALLVVCLALYFFKDEDPPRRRRSS